MPPRPNRSRVVLIGLDGFPLRLFDPAVTPNLWRLAHAGGSAPGGGRSGQPSTTYPGFASLLTGLRPASSGIRTTAHRPGAVPGWAGADRLTAPTILHLAREAGLDCAAVFGDHRLMRVLAADEILEAWPPGGEIPDGTPVDAHGYAADGAVARRLVESAAVSDNALVFGHLNETDTAGHDHGPQAPETIAAAAAADAILGDVVAALERDWARTLVVVTSDHDMAARLPYPEIDPTAGHEAAGLAADWIADGAAAWVRLSPGADPHLAIKVLSSLDGVEGWRWRDPDRLLLLASPGRVFASAGVPRAGIHGSISTARTLAIVGGGHPAVAALGREIARRPPKLQDWAPTIASVLRIDMPTSDGRDLLEDPGEDVAAG